MPFGTTRRRHRGRDPRPACRIGPGSHLHDRGDAGSHPVRQGLSDAGQRGAAVSLPGQRSFEEVSERFVGDLIERVFQGSREQLFVRLFKERKLTARERAVLSQDSQGGRAMNGLVPALFWSSVTATLVARRALILDRVASRTGAACGSWVAAARCVRHRPDSAGASARCRHS